jgi:hypothetical protein
MNWANFEIYQLGHICLVDGHPCLKFVGVNWILKIAWKFRNRYITIKIGYIIFVMDYGAKSIAVV